MNNWPNILPITAIIAVVIFLIKESLEFGRRRLGDQRKLRALKALCARECELNYWTIKQLRSVLKEIPTAENGNSQIFVHIEKTAGGRPYARIHSDDGGTEHHTGIPEVHRETMSKFLLEVAMLDRSLFDLLEPAYDRLAEVAHVRESLLAIDEHPRFLTRDAYLEGFAGYGLSKLQESESALKALYFHCAGKALEKHRLR